MKGSCLYDPKMGAVHVSRDVVFQENIFWPWEQNKGSEVVFPGHYADIENMSGGESMDETEHE